MQDNTILDDLSKPSITQPNKRIQRIFLGLELALWGGLCILGCLSKSFGITNVMLPLRIAISLFGLFYLVCPTWIFGSIGWRRHIGSHLVGILLMFSVLSIASLIVSLGGAAEQLQGAKHFNVVASLVTWFFYSFRKDSLRGGQFFLNVLARTVSMALIAAFLIEVFAIRAIN